MPVGAVRARSEASTRRGPRLHRWLLIADLMALCGSALLVSAVVPTAAVGGDGLADVVLLAAGLGAWVVIADANGLYADVSRPVGGGVADDLWPVIESCTAWTVGMIVVLAVTGLEGMSTTTLAVLWALSTTLVALFRGAALALARRREWYRQNTLVLGTGPHAVELAAKIRRHPEYGLWLLGFLEGCGADDDRDAGQDRPCGVPLISGPVDIVRLAVEWEVEKVILADRSTLCDRCPLVRDLTDAGVAVAVVPDETDAIGSRARVGDIEGMFLVTVPPTYLSPAALRAKRVLDLGVGVLALVALSPLFLLSALAIKLDSPGPVFFRQRRVGHDGRRFEVFKFRTMVKDAEAHKAEVAALNFHGGEMETGMFKVRRDPRVTRVGRLLRRTSIDELPQLINVVLGQMSLVGPRPLIENEDRQIAGDFRRRLTLTPGLTGLWQVNGRSEVPFEEMLKLDYLYVRNWSLWTDIKLLAKTAGVVMRGSGAY